MGSFFANSVSFFQRNPVVYWSGMALLLVIAYLGFSRLKIDNSIYSIFPQGEEFQRFNQVLQENNLNKQVLFSIDAKGKDSDELAHQLDSLQSLLENELDGLVREIQGERMDQTAEIIDYYHRVLPALLDDKAYMDIKAILHADTMHRRMEKVADQMRSVNSFFTRRILAQDPLGIAWPTIQKLRPKSDSSGVTVEEGILVSADGSRALATAVLNFELNDNEKIEKLNVKLESFKTELNQSTSFGFDYFGTFQIAHENAKQVKKDTSLTLLLSLSLILLLLISYYRSILMPVYFILPAVFSGFFGLGIVGYLQPEISAISIATAAMLMGIVLDYSFHFFTHYAHSKDLVRSVRELSFPMIVGSFTTVAAFSALLFTDSIVLKNFGLIALSVLSSAALFTLLFLPGILRFVRFKPNKGEQIIGNWKVPQWMHRVGIYLILICTVIFLFKANDFQFDADLNNLSYHSDELVEKEEFYTGINPLEDKKLHVFVSDSNLEGLRIKNFALFEELNDFKSKSGLEEIVSIAPYMLPQEIIENGSNKWLNFWNKEGTNTLTQLKLSAQEFDFSESSFLPFERWIRRGATPPEQELEWLETLGLKNLVYEKNGVWQAVTSVVVDRDQLSSLRRELGSLDGVYIFDVSEMANALLLTVQEDFNYLLLFSSLLVFFSLLLIYGRLELAIFAFFPMVVAWVWILAIASMFGISFNFVNIIVATFIFGLGDDFSIFVTDGLLQKYKTNTNSIQSYKSAIVLSGVTTIIGTGALYFAYHPAIHSIAVISVVGIGCIMLVTLVVQPSVFRWFVSNRTKKKRSPMTFLGLIMSIFLFGYFFIGCLILNAMLLLVIPFPASKRGKRAFMNFLVSKLAKSTLYLGFHIKKRIHYPERLNFSKPSIIVANHSSFLDILSMIMLHPKVIIMVKKWVYYSPFFGFFIRYSGYLFIAEGTEYNLDVVKKRIADGYSIMVFPEGTRSKDGKMKRFHKGAFYLAQQLHLDIQPIVLIGVHYVNPKNDLIIKSGTIDIVPLERISCESDLFKERFGIIAKKVQALMRTEMEVHRKRIQTAANLRNRVQYNYLYKGPVIEWYVRIKWRFEEKNYAYYDQLIGNRKRIYDIGCGLGYLSLFLHYRDEEREIIGVDYDAEKIAIAQNTYDKSSNLTFVEDDVRTLDFEQADVVMFNDVLHYMSKEKQFLVLEKVVSILNEGGIILIRDGITDLNERHRVTRKTEKYSTRIAQFNKTTEELVFLSSEDIFNFAKEQNVHCEMIEQSKKTSNVLFVLRKGNGNGK